MAIVRGLTKVGNEEEIIQDTLDNWSLICDGGIHVYCDCCTDGTAEICRDHPAVVEVIDSNLYDPDRARADAFNRQQILRSALRFEWDWIAYFDADEQIHDFPVEVLDRPDFSVVATQWHDVYITEEDIDAHYQSRDWVSIDPVLIPHFFRRSPYLGFRRPDQRIMDHEPLAEYPVYGYTRHYGLGFSVESWEKKCEYYQQWPQYAAKWAARRGKAVNKDYMSVRGLPLKRWSDIRRRQDEHSRLCALD